MSKIRWAGLGLIACGLLFAVLFVYLPIRNGPDGFMGGVRINALVFVPLAVITGLAFVIGDVPVLDAFQARPIPGAAHAGALDSDRLRSLHWRRVLADQDSVAGTGGDGNTRCLAASAEPAADEMTAAA
jgi:hypothetical protein